MNQSTTSAFSDRVLILGVSDLTPILVEVLEPDVEFLIIAKDAANLKPSIQSSRILEGDPSPREILEEANIKDATVVIIAGDTDAHDAMAILTVTELNSSVRIVAAASDRENVEKLEHVGADRVTSPDFLGSRLLIESAVMGKNIDELVEEFADHVH
ncbi:NAD(P)-binding protein [Natrinema soli]|uniref:NAD(P)-binding protein n=1 Tax=Natrinema soli TaxID=1930624 RepID=A0ABD5SNT7_9EURY|nr:NAD(P)-binding protein [Natrinema soli]